jgi:hypothetical protein
MSRDHEHRRWAGRGLLLGYLVVCVLAAALVEVITAWPLTSMVIVLGILYALMVIVGATILRPLAAMTSVIFRSIRSENRRDTRRRPRGFSRRRAPGTAAEAAPSRRQPAAAAPPAPPPPVAGHRS